MAALDIIPLDAAEVRERFQAFADRNTFVHLLTEGTFPDLKASVHSNRCVLGLRSDRTGQNWIVVSSIDNLVKGASGQALQNMNLMFDLPEETTLL